MRPPGRPSLQVLPVVWSSQPRTNERTEVLPSRKCSLALRCPQPPPWRVRGPIEVSKGTDASLGPEHVHGRPPLPGEFQFASLVTRAGVVQWQYRSFPSFGRGFDSHRPLQQLDELTHGAFATPRFRVEVRRLFDLGDGVCHCRGQSHVPEPRADASHLSRHRLKRPRRRAAGPTVLLRLTERVH
jgi:hypothetical protein